MAKSDIISRLKLESGEFDSKIKRASQELTAYSEHCRKMGLEMGYANRDAKEFAKQLGSMATTATTARGKVNELSDAFVNLKTMYNAMTDAEKQGQFGKNLAASLDQLKQRTQEAKAELADITKELQGGGISSGGGFLSGIGDKMSGALQVFGGNVMTKGLELATSAVSTFIDSIKEAAQQGIELAKQGEGIRIAFERLNRPDLLDQLREATHGTVTDLELMQQAVKFNDFKLNINEMGTLLAFAQQKAKDTGQSVNYMVDSIVTGLGRQSLMILDNLGLSASEIKERMKQTGDMTSAVAAIIRDQMAEAGDYVETAADRASRADAELKNAMEDLGRTLLPITQDADNMWKAIEVGALNAINSGIKPVIEVLVDLKYQFDQIYDTVVNSPVTGGFLDWLETAWDVTKKIIPGLSTIVALKNAITSGGSDSSDAGGGASIGGAITTGMGTILPEVVVTPRKKTTTTTKGNKQELDELQKVQKEIADLTKEAYTADESRQAEIQKQIAGLQAQEQKLIKIRDLVTGKTEPKELAIVSHYDTGDVSDGQAMIDKIKGDLAQANIDEDMKRLSQMMADGLRAGLQEQDLTDIATELKRKIMEGGDVPDEVWQEFEEYIQENLDNADFSFNINFNEKSAEEAAKKQKKEAAEMAKDWQAAGNAINAVGQAMQQIEDPAAKVMGTIAQAVASVALGASQAIAQAGNGSAGGPWGWIAFAAAATATMIGTIASIHNATGYANGGIVDGSGGGFVGGTAYSGDNIGNVRLDAGELVLSRSQQGNLAEQLEGSSMQNMQLETRLGAEEIIFVLNNNANRRGYGRFIDD